VSNIYLKLGDARVQFQAANVKQSGQNKFAGYSYYELSDILPMVNRIGKELGFICAVSFDKDLATLSVIDAEDPTQVIKFYSPMSTATLKGCHEVQNLGAVLTYIKRYLYQNAFEIVEHDALNITHDPNEKPVELTKSQWINKIKKATKQDLVSIGKGLGESKLPESDMEILRQEYKIRQKELAPQA
jgi:hypothetical protein